MSLMDKEEEMKKMSLIKEKYVNERIHMLNELK